MNTTFNFWVNNRPNSRGKYDIFIRVTQLRKHKLIKTGIEIPSRDDFNKKSKQDNWIRGKSENTKQLNLSLAAQLKAIKDEMESLNKRSKNPSKESIIQKYKGGSSQDFITFLRLVISRFEKAGQYRTKKRYVQLLNKLIDFESDYLPFDAITVTFLKSFESYLSELHQNTRYEHFKNMKATFNQAIQEDIIEPNQSPFLRFSFSQVPTSKEKLTFEEISRLKALKLASGTRTELARNCFMFSFYCGGIRVGDLISLRWNNIREGKLTYVMSKTRRSKLTKRELPLIKEALAIIKQYQQPSSKDSDFIFPLMRNEDSKFIDTENKISSGHEKRIFDLLASKNSILNNNLKKLAVAAEIKKPLSFHLARHSFAQYAINKGIAPKMLQTILGHEKFSTTEIYITSLDDKQVEETMKGLFR